MIGNVEICSYENTYYYSILNRIYNSENINILTLNYKICGLKLYKKNLICYGRHNISFYKVDCLTSQEDDVLFVYTLLEHKTCQYLISDVFISDNNFSFVTNCGKLYTNRCLTREYKVGNAQRVCFSITGDVLVGNYGYFMIEIIDKLRIFNLTQGRCFDLELNQYGFCSATEDRRVCVVDSHGLWYIQETRSYATKCSIYRNYVGYITKNGDFKLYYKRRLYLHYKFGLDCLNTITFSQNIVFLGLTSGHIIRFKLREDKENLFVTKDFVIENLEIKNIGKSLKVMHLAQTRSEKLIASSIKLYKYILYKNEVQVKNSRGELQIYKVTKPLTVKFNCVGTKNGWLIRKTKAYKISNDPILKIKKIEKRIELYTKNKIYFFTSKKDLRVTDKKCGTFTINSQTKDIHETRGFLLYFRYRKKQTGFKKILCAMQIGEFIVIGTSNNTIVSIYKNEIYDSLVILGSPSCITHYKNNIYVSTQAGYLYKVKFKLGVFYVKVEIKTKYKIIHICYNKKLFFTDCSGSLNRIRSDKRIESIVRFKKYVSNFTVKGHVFYGCTSDGCLIIYNIKNNTTELFKIDAVGLYKLIYKNNKIFLCGDSHKIHLFCCDTKNKIKSILASSACLVELQKDKYIYSVSDDGFLKVWTSSIDFVKHYDLFISSPTCCILTKNVCYIFGLGMETINLE